VKQPTQIGDSIGAVEMTDIDGRPVDFDSLLDAPRVIALVRYYGCMPCRAYLHQLENIRPSLEAAGASVAAVGGAADYQARDLMEHGIGFPLLLDPGHTLYRALDIHHIKWRQMLSPRTWRKYLSAARLARQGRITDHPLQVPGLAIIGPGRKVQTLHRGRTLGDYPPVSDVLEEARRIGRTD
jgi:peroxiredoxin